MHIGMFLSNPHLPDIRVAREMEALAAGVFRVLNGEEEAKDY